MNEPGESIEHRSGLSEFHTDGPHTEKARDVKNSGQLFCFGFLCYLVVFSKSHIRTECTTMLTVHCHTALYPECRH